PQDLGRRRLLLRCLGQLAVPCLELPRRLRQVALKIVNTGAAVLMGLPGARELGFDSSLPRLRAHSEPGTTFRAELHLGRALLGAAGTVHAASTERAGRRAARR